jgi:small nuclear ribonucleoprotein (snRNP)-like protein
MVMVVGGGVVCDGFSRSQHWERIETIETMESQERWQLLTPLFGQIVVVDLKSSYVCLGTLASCDNQFLELLDADLHDFRDSTATREVYVYDSVRFGIRRNRARVLVRQDDVLAVTRFDDIAAS